MSENIASNGKVEVMLQTDQDPPTLSLKRIVAVALRVRFAMLTVEQESPVGDHRANGTVDTRVKGERFGQNAEVASELAWGRIA